MMDLISEDARKWYTQNLEGKSKSWESLQEMLIDLSNAPVSNFDRVLLSFLLGFGMKE